MNQRIEAVVFDIGRVLVQWDMRVLFRQLLGDEAEVEWVYRNVVTEAWHGQHDAGRPIAEMVAERSAEFPRYAPVIRAYAERFNDTIPGPVPGTSELVEQLHEIGVPLYAITNFGADTWTDFRPTFPLLDRFRDIVVSGVEKMVKPDPAIYALAARRFGRDPGTMLFIDDSLPNVISARECGWHAHHFTSADLLADDLRTRGLL
ncbi:MAG: HAD family hydrolase [Novosphingobium sp.]|uniref:HAD family hydrolase n=1 Tax=Novosphingobium sp. TaxID=1874826 RepID=UPI003919E5DD|nr:HAD family phosphatase [Novosphingobium sp.]